MGRSCCVEAGLASGALSHWFSLRWPLRQAVTPPSDSSALLFWCGLDTDIVGNFLKVCPFLPARPASLSHERQPDPWL